MNHFIGSFVFSRVIRRFPSLNLLLSWRSSGDLEHGSGAMEFRISHRSLLFESMRFGFYVQQQTHNETVNQVKYSNNEAIEKNKESIAKSREFINKKQALNP